MSTLKLNNAANAATATTPEQSSGFITAKQLRQHIPICDRTLRSHIKAGHIPAVVLPGSRKLLFHRETVFAALLRYQSGV